MSDVIGVIHAKGTSERLLRKNFCLLDRTPLFLCQALNLSTLVGRENVYVDSECPEIHELSRVNGFNIFKRDVNLASNLFGGVGLLKNFLLNIDSDANTVIQLFPPMPIIDLEALSNGLNEVKSGKFKSAHFRLEKKFYEWRNDSPFYKFINNEIPNSIDLNVTDLELPTAYITNIKNFLAEESRISEKIYKMRPQSGYFEIDIDDAIDLSLASQIIKIPFLKSKFNFFERVRVKAPPIIFWDVDGTLTEGSYNSGENNEVFKSFSTLDGIAFKEINDLGSLNCIVSSSKSAKIIEQRAAIVNCEVMSSVSNKVEACKKFSESKGYNLRECYFIGNDLNDLDVMDSVGRSFCPIDANEEVKRLSENLSVNGGKGVVRALVNLLKSEKCIRRDVV